MAFGKEWAELDADPARQFPVLSDGRVDPDGCRVLRDGSRWYRLPGTDTVYPSVTTVTKAWPEGAEYLGRWQRGIIAERWLSDPGYAAVLAAEHPNSARRMLIDLSDENRDFAANRGMAIHTLLEMDILGTLEGEAGARRWLAWKAPEQDPEDCLATLEQATEALIAAEVTPLAVEALAWRHSGRDNLRYAGAVDIIGSVPADGRVASMLGNAWYPNDLMLIIDLKTGKGVYPSHGIQLAAYCGADQYVAGSTYAELAQPLHAGLILHVSRKGWALYPFSPFEGWALWMECTRVFHQLGTNPLKAALQL